jgi:hypothetical protein
MGLLIEAILTVSTLSGYYMVTNGFLFYGAIVALVSNVLWIFYGMDKKSQSLIVVNALFAMINFAIIVN